MSRRNRKNNAVTTVQSAPPSSFVSPAVRGGVVTSGVRPASPLVVAKRGAALVSANLKPSTRPGRTVAETARPASSGAMATSASAQVAAGFFASRANEGFSQVGRTGLEDQVSALVSPVAAPVPAQAARAASQGPTRFSALKISSGVFRSPSTTVRSSAVPRVAPVVRPKADTKGQTKARVDSHANFRGYDAVAGRGREPAPCKPRPKDNSPKGRGGRGGPRRFIPWCG